MKNSHEYFMRLALEEAQKGEGLVSPNPLVGSVLVFGEEVIAKGFHGEMGKLHAERVVLEKLKVESSKFKVRKKSLGSDYTTTRLYDYTTLYVTLEPCCHHGKTPPCTDAIIELGIKTVVIAQTDPNPLVSGKGTQQLRDAGITVIEGVLEKEAQDQIRFFRHSITKKEPYFVGKLAVSADGFYSITNDQLRITNNEDNKNQRYFLISSSETKQKTRAMRKAFDAILVGKKTLLIDNPNLGSDEKDPLRIVLCQKADFSVQGLQAFRDKNVIIACKEKTQECDFQGQILFYKTLKDLKQQLFDLGIQSVLVEGGGEILQLFLQENLLQELLIIQSKNCVLGTGKSAPKIPNIFSLVSIDDNKTDVLETWRSI